MNLACAIAIGLSPFLGWLLGAAAAVREQRARIRRINLERVIKIRGCSFHNSLDRGLVIRSRDYLGGGA